MAKDIGVLVIHGIGRQDLNPPKAPDDVTFSKDLHRKLGRYVTDFTARVAYREVYWADVMAERMNRYIAQTRGQFSWGPARGFVMHNLSDASGYRPTRDPSPDSVYAQSHGRISTALGALHQALKPGAPVVVYAHSLGGYLMSNYIYDMQRDTPDTPQCAMCAQIAALVTFGCNIPLLTMDIPYDDVRAIKAPNARLPTAQQLDHWWLNYYAHFDVLGYPLADAGRGYAQMTALQDRKIGVAGINLFKRWSPLAHNAYWGEDNMLKPSAQIINAL